MVLDERSRHELHLRLEQAIGAEAAATLMEHLPPVGWGDVATRRDLDQLRAATAHELDQLRAATARDLDELRAATAQDLEQFADRLRAEFYRAMSEQTRTIVFASMSTTVGAVLATGALAFAAARLG